MKKLFESSDDGKGGGNIYKIVGCETEKEAEETLLNDPNAGYDPKKDRGRVKIIDITDSPGIIVKQP